MKTSKLFRWSPIAVLLCSVIVATLWAASPNPATTATKAAKPGKPEKGPKADALLFNSTNVLTIEIEMAAKDFDDLKGYQWRMGPQQERKKVQVTVREGHSVFTNVSLQLKGAAGSFRSIDDKPAFTMNFDKFSDGQKFHGLQKLSLNNSVQDPTYLSEQFSRELFVKAGVPTPRATHALVKLNGKELGLYVLLEGWDKQFLKNHFKNTKGNLYDGGFLKEVTDELSLNAGDDPKNQSDRKALADAAKETDLAKRAERLEKVLDVDRFLAFVAMDVMLWNWDGYAMNKNNWRLYHDPEKDKMVFMPHGLDQMFWKPDGSIVPPMGGLVAKSVLEVPQFRKRYFDKLKQLRSTVFNVESMTNRVQTIAAKVRPVLQKIDPEEAGRYNRSVADFSRSISERARSLDRQLETPIEPLKFDEQGLVAVKNWKSKVDFGRPVLKQTKDASGKDILEAGSPDGSSIGSFRTAVWLEKGKYKLEGRIKTEKLAADPGDPRAGAGFRTKPNRPDNSYTKGDTDWQNVAREFDVQEPLTEVQLLCEFRAMEGKAYFDLASLKLRKVK